MVFAVVIVTYNRLSLLQECISACLSQTLPPAAVIVVDNCSTDGTREFLQSAQSDVVRVFRSDENLGGAWGFAKGVELLGNVDYDAALLIDDDAIIRPDFLHQIDVAAAAHPGYVAYSGAVFVDGKVDCGHRQVVSSRLLGKMAMVHADSYSAASFECDTATFCGLVVRRHAIQAVGLPRSEYFIWFDDVDFSLRLSALSRILNVNAAALDHKTSVSFSLNKLCWKTYYGDRNYADLLKRHFGPIATLWNLAKKSVKILRAFATRQNEGGFVAWRLFADAICDGLRGRLGKNPNYLPH